MPLRADPGSVGCALKRIAFDTPEGAACAIGITRTIFGLALDVHAELVSLVRAFRRCDRRLHRCLSAPLERRVNHRDCIKTRSSRLVQVGVDDAGEVESSSSARRGGQVMALDVNKSVTRGLLGSSTRIQTRTPVAKDQAKRYFVDR